MRIFISFYIALVGALLLALPDLTRPGLLFGVPVPAGFREGPDGKGATRVFRIIVGAVGLAGVCASLLVPLNALGLLMIGAPFGVMLAAGITFYTQYRRLRPIAVRIAPMRGAELGTIPDELPWFAWLGTVPFATLIAAAWYLHLNWARIPERFPVHWGADGLPNRWVERTVKGVYGPVVFGALMCAWFLVLALSGWHGSRRSRLRSVLLVSMVVGASFIGALFAGIAVNPLLNIPVWVMVFSPMAILIPGIVVLLRKFMDPREPVEPTPNECWKAGLIYYNPDDAALFVQKRFGLGYTFNFANPWSWILLLGLGMVVASAFFVLA
jgi:uncharacterized membrane protein